MKYEITQEDKDTMAFDMQHNRTLKYIRDLSYYKFTIGDVLIREEKYHNYQTSTSEWKPKIASCDLPYKYVYVFENELGVGYIRRLSVNGRKFVEKPVCVTEFDPDQTRFTLDPEYADHMLLAGEDDEFDAKTRYAEAKKKREQIHRKNKKLAIQLPDEAAAIAWMQTLKVGDQLWWGHSIGSIHKDAYYVTEINLKTPPGTSPAPGNPFGYSYGYNQFSPHIKVSTSAPGSNGGGYANSLHASSMSRYYVFTQRPIFFDEIIN